MSSALTIRVLAGDEIGRDGARLGAAFGALLKACVDDGASVGFIAPFAPAAAEAFWTGRIFPAVMAGKVVLVVAERDGRLVGTGQIDLDTPANQPHRSEVRKVLVDPAARRQGIARAIMARLETEARAHGRSLLTLDTRSDDAAEPLYLSLGYLPVGRIPGYCLDVASTRLDSTTIMYKRLA